MILGVLCNVVISKDCSWSFVGCGKIFDFGILWTIRLEISFLMIITSEPINVMYMYAYGSENIVFPEKVVNKIHLLLEYLTQNCTYGQGILS